MTFDQDDLRLTVGEAGSGRTVMVLHGGGGPASVAAIVDHLAAKWHVLAPVIPGFDGTPRPTWFSGVDDIALALLELLRRRDLQDVVLVGSSIGGWIAAEMAVRDAEVGRVCGLALIDGVGVEIGGQPLRDVFALDARSLVDYSFHDGAKFYVDPASLTDEQRAAQQQNLQSLRVYAGNPYMHDPKLLRRVPRIQVPTLVLWGDSDRIATPAYGAAYAQAFPHARFDVVTDAGHLPHIEAPAATFAALDPFLDQVPSSAS
jgi:pimeloyl-ACP methyl ester carboxylesterase